ncbi:MAG: hypothetical protein IKY45_03425 [Clostridia bacterium]|nr:hypothetical protein [Clostridia bacterium]
MEHQKNFEDALYGVGNRVKEILLKIPIKVKQSAEEIRLREGLPLALTLSGDTVFVNRNGEVSFDLTDSFYIVDREDINECFENLTGGSVYAHEDELKNGFIIMKNGCRAGVCGNFSAEGFLSEVTSVNIRISREIIGCANEILRNYNGRGLLIAGPAGCGKTTILRDTVRQLSHGICGKFYRACVIDSRGEISGENADIGKSTDVIHIDDKAKGIEIALRTMFPEVIAFDEIANTEELKRVKESFFSGVDIITTAHIGNKEELMSRNVTADLIKNKIVSTVAVLPRLHGDKIEIYSACELL